MGYFPQKLQQIQSAGNSTTTPLNAQSTFTGTAELNDYGDVMVQVATDQDGTIWYDFSNDGVNWDTTLPFPYRTGAINAPHVLVKGYRYFRARFQNTSLVNQTFLRMYTVYGELQKLTAPTSGTLSQSYDSLATRPTNFNVEISEGKRQGYTSVTKFGGANGVSANTRQTVWTGNGEYTGFDSDVAETLNVQSSNSGDTGSLVTSGTADSGNADVLIDTSATFIADGVQAGDIAINDTDGTHCIVETVVSETELNLINAYNDVTWNGKAYRIATASSTGAAVVRLGFLLDDEFELQKDEYVILNGVSAVSTVNQYIRCHRVNVVLAADPVLVNEGEITVENASDGTITYAHVDIGEGTTLQTTFTVPDDYLGILQRFFVTIARDGAQAASADVRLKVRRRGEPWRTVKYFEVTTASGVNYSQAAPLKFEEYTDVKVEVDDASATISIAAEMEGFVVTDN